MSPTVTIEKPANERSAQRTEQFDQERGAIAQRLLLVVIYAWAVWFTKAAYMADTGGYVVSILAFDGLPQYVLENPFVRDHLSENPFWDFGHLFWRPLGLALFKTTGFLTSSLFGIAPNASVLMGLIALNLVAGAACVLLLHSLIQRLTDRPLVATIVTAAFIFSHAFLNFAQTGSPYIAGLALILLGVHILLRERPDTAGRRALLAGFAFAAAIWLWLLYVLVVFAAISAPLFIGRVDRERMRLVVRTAVAFLVLTGMGYLVVMLHLGIHSPGEVRAWISAAAHGVNTSGVTRLLFGLSRSLISTDAGILFKRYLLGDPFNPVSAVDLLTLGTWKLILFYLAIGSVVVALWAARQWRLLGLCALSALPVALFAASYDGGAVERYLPLFPFLFLAVAACFATRSPALLKLAPAVLLLIMVATNVTALAGGALDRRQETTTARVQALLPDLRPGSNLVTSHLQDDLVLFQAGFPFHPVNRYTYRLYPLVAPNTDRVAEWRELAAARITDVWSQDADVWVSMRLLQPQPRSEWNWVEGDDPRVSWHDLHGFFAALQFERVIGGDDGFALLARSEGNARLLTRN